MAPAFPRLQTSIRFSLLLRAFLIVLLAVGVFAATAYHFVAEPAISRLAETQMAQTAGEMEARVQKLLASVEVTVKTSRGWGANGDLDLDQLRRFNRFFIPVIEHNPEISSAVFAHESGREIFLLQGAGGKWTNRLSDPARWGQRTYWITWSPEGEVAGVEMREQDYDARSRPWFIGAMALQRDQSVFWAAPYIFYTTREPGMTRPAAGPRATAADT